MNTAARLIDRMLVSSKGMAALPSPLAVSRSVAERRDGCDERVSKRLIEHLTNTVPSVLAEQNG
jgi:hypothetical protein